MDAGGGSCCAEKVRLEAGTCGDGILPFLLFRSVGSILYSGPDIQSWQYRHPGLRKISLTYIPTEWGLNNECILQSKYRVWITRTPRGDVNGDKKYRCSLLVHITHAIPIIYRNARIQGMTKDLNLVGHQFNWALTIFYITYLV